MIKMEVNGKIARGVIDGGFKEMIEDTNRILITIYDAIGKLHSRDGEKTPVELFRSIWMAETLKALGNLGTDKNTIVDLSNGTLFEGKLSDF